MTNSQSVEQDGIVVSSLLWHVPLRRLLWQVRRLIFRK